MGSNGKVGHCTTGGKSWPRGESESRRESKDESIERERDGDRYTDVTPRERSLAMRVLTGERVAGVLDRSEARLGPGPGSEAEGSVWELSEFESRGQ